MPVRERNRCRERIEALATADLDVDEARLEAIEALRRAVGFERWCWPLTDPSSVLSMSGIAEFDLWPSLPRLVALEQHGDDVMTKPRLVRGPQASTALSAATRGDLARSRRWRECLQPYGIGDELMTACRETHGCWGTVELMRDADDAAFDDDDLQLLHELAPTFGTMLRRALLRAPRTDRIGSELLAPATLILDVDLRPTSWTPAFAAWTTELGAGDGLPPAVYEIGARASAPDREETGLATSVRLRTRSGQWAVLEGAALEGADRGDTAITIRTATADEIFDLLCRIYDLTARERQLVALMRDGLSTAQLAAALCISRHTVQDHLKSIFAKARVSSRRELISDLAGRRFDAAAARDG